MDRKVQERQLSVGSPCWEPPTRLSREPEEGARPGAQAEEALVKGAQRFWDPCSKAYIDPSGTLGGLAHHNYMLLRATGRRKSSKVNQTLKPESMGISVESVEWVLVINTYWAWVGAGFWLAPKKVSSWGAQTLTSSQELYLPYFWSDHSLLPTWSFWEQEALPRQRAGAP